MRKQIANLTSLSYLLPLGMLEWFSFFIFLHPLHKCLSLSLSLSLLLHSACVFFLFHSPSLATVCFMNCKVITHYELALVSATELLNYAERKRERERDEAKRLSQVNRPTGWMDLFGWRCSLLAPILLLPVLLSSWCYCSVCSMCSMDVCRSPTCTSTRVHVFGPFFLPSLLLFDNGWQCFYCSSLQTLLRSESNKRIIYRATVHPFVFPLSLSLLSFAIIALSLSLSLFYPPLICPLMQLWFPILSLSLPTFVSILFFSLLQVSSPQATDVTRERQWHTKLTKET